MVFSGWLVSRCVVMGSSGVGRVSVGFWFGVVC